MNSYTLLVALKDYLQIRLNEKIANFSLKNDCQLEKIKEFSIGYKDILTGLRDYPAIIILENKREICDNYFNRLYLLVGFAFNTSDKEQLIEFGQYYKDIIQECLLEDNTFGGLCIDSNNLIMEDGYTSDVFVISSEFNIDIERSIE